MTAGLSPSGRRAYVRFRNAVVDFSDDPSPHNLIRYLAASRELENSRGRRVARPRSTDLGMKGLLRAQR